MARVERDVAGVPATIIGVFRDVTFERKAMQAIESERVEADRRAERMRQLASTDCLTKLANRRSLVEHAETLLSRGETVNLLLLDLDRFKSINDRYGHDGGDLILAAFGQACMRFSDVATCIGRIGGEEFAILLESAEEGVAVGLADALRLLVAAEPLRLRKGVDIRYTFSAGLARSTSRDDWQTLFSRADQALYRAEREGRDRLAVAA